MCFSSTASFVAGGALVAIGVASVVSVKDKRYLPIALIPVFFGIQQFSEGMLWLNPTEKIWAYVFLFFALILWPTFSPFAAFIAEPDNRRKILFPFLLLGVGVSAFLTVKLIQSELTVAILNHSFDYTLSTAWTRGHWGVVPYVIATCGSFLASSHRLLQLFGGLVSLAFLVSILAYQTVFISVWCFFAAPLSLILYLHVRRRRSCTRA